MTRLLIIIPADILRAARTAAAGVLGDSALAEFVPAGSPTGEMPATHWWLAGVFTVEEVARVQMLQPDFPDAVILSYDLAQEAGKPLEILTGMGLQPLKLNLP
ncbi:MAG: hypothetical protein B7Z37_16900 [Verrucomicrobia bacterium 12-59-8]|nr:MAG: hypothetical protein B7Z37_16900 [Verrucomicrobia bacterium 12-59-8]